MNSDMPLPKEKPASSRDPPVAHLACEPCKKRKIKCDREYPTCTTCRLFNRECIAVIRPRLPRGRKGGRKEASSELRARVNRLESLVQSLSKTSPPKAAAEEKQPQPPFRSPHASSDASSQGQARHDSSTSPSDASSSSRGKKDSISDGGTETTRYLGSSLWDTLSEEVDGLRAILAEPDDEYDSDPGTVRGSGSPGDTVTPSSDLFGFANSTSYDLPEPGSNAAKIFSKIYLENVDPIIRLVFAPAFCAHLETGVPYLDYPSQSVQLDAVKAAIYYACVSSVNEDSCRKTFGVEQQILRNMWKSTTEAALNRADYLNSNDFATLQALVIYLSCLRSHTSNRTPWTLAALPVRIGQAMGLHREDTYKGVCFFQGQLFRRLWYRILDLDLQFACDRGTDPMIQEDSYNTVRPLNITDTDMVPGQLEPCPERIGITETSLLVLCAQSDTLVRKLNFVSPRGAQRSYGDERDNWQARTRAVQDYLAFIPTIIPPGFVGKNTYERETAALAPIISSALELWAMRPLQRHPGLPPPPYPSSTILTIAVQALERFEYVSRPREQESYPFRWASTGWLPWHPFAVCMAELCQAQEDARLVARAWKIADSLYRYMSLQVAEGAAGPLWIPIKKLMRKAEMNRPQAPPRQNRSPPQAGALRSLSVTEAPPLDVDTAMLEATHFGYGSLPQAPVPGLMPPADLVWPGDLAAAGMPQDPSWNEWSMFMDNLYMTQAPEHAMWAGQVPGDHRMYAPPPLPTTKHEEGPLYQWTG
ncbi:hypothetical protein FH972_025734 [Carpinus fangiana]|uniref:Zn(2)-C6 fungal-type domain-containing protein n=1 Tax=Carpinus fangiana TaxID=176857 RepID=A0A5N6L4F9_9ROSI|nr:hypothetical protein FH972_025734 [Carpinus fangiana]